MLTRPLSVAVCRYAVEVGRKQGLRPCLVASLGIQESNWNPIAVGRNTEIGPLQIKAMHCERFIGAECSADSAGGHIRAALGYFATLHNRAKARHGGTDSDAIAAYRCGPGGYWSPQLNGLSLAYPMETCRPYADEVTARMWEICQ